MTTRFTCDIIFYSNQYIYEYHKTTCIIFTLFRPTSKLVLSGGGSRLTWEKIISTKRSECILCKKLMYLAQNKCIEAESKIASGKVMYLGAMWRWGRVGDILADVLSYRSPASPRERGGLMPHRDTQLKPNWTTHYIKSNQTTYQLRSNQTKSILS